MAETAPERTPIYLDVDDDITAVVKKIADVNEKEISLVTPKRSSVLQSVVNQKLIKKAARGSEKDLAIITDDKKIKMIASGLGLATAPNLRTKPVVADINMPEQNLPSDVIEEDSPDSAAKSAAIAGAAAYAVHDASDPDTPNSSVSNPAVASAESASKKKPKGKKIPDFNRFKKKALIGIAICIGLVGVLFYLLYWLPSADITISGRTENLPVSFSMTVDTVAESPNYAQQVLPGTRQELNKTLTANFKSTGKKDIGTKATGNVSVKNCEDTDSRSLSAGTKFTASNGKVFQSTSGVVVPGGSFSGGGSNCTTSSVSVPVAAAENGPGYNIEATAYSSASLSGNFVLSGSQMTGGSSKTVGVVTQSDVDTAKNQLLQAEQNNAKKELAKQFQDSDYIIDGSFSQNVGEIISNPPVGSETDNGSVVVKVAYFEYGVKKDQINELLKRQALELSAKNDPSLGIADNGLSQAKFTPAEKVSDTTQKFDVKTTALLGPDINFDQLKQEIKGKRFSVALDKIKSYPNVSDAQIKLSPFYKKKIPRRTEQIQIKIDVPRDQQ